MLDGLESSYCLADWTRLVGREGALATLLLGSSSCKVVNSGSGTGAAGALAFPVLLTSSTWAAWSKDLEVWSSFAGSTGLDSMGRGSFRGSTGLEVISFSWKISKNPKINKISYSGDLNNGPVWYLDHGHVSYCWMVHGHKNELKVCNLSGRANHAAAQMTALEHTYKWGCWKCLTLFHVLLVWNRPRTFESVFLK